MKAGLVQLAAFLDLALAAFHIAFWRLFRWPESLAAAGRLNAAVMQVMNLMLIYVFVVMGAALLWMGPAAPAPLLLAAAGFGAVRLALQPSFFGLRSRPSQAFTTGMALLTLAHLGATFA
ncbi:MAG: hypothetical protein IOC63_04350 [Methylobacterium sp.]|nr:hypothetical protein [Methylobacterium sp.]